MKFYCLLFISLLLMTCSSEEEAPEVVPEPEPTTFLEKHDNTAWDNSDVGRIGFADDTSRFLWNVGLLECTYFSDNTSFEGDGGVYTIRIERNVPEEFIYSISLTVEENTASYVKVITVANNVLTERTSLTVNGESDGEPVAIIYTKLPSVLSSYCN